MEKIDKSSKLNAQFREKQYALTFDSKGLRILLRVHVNLCHSKWKPPPDIEKKTVTKLEEMKRDGKIEYYVTHFDKLKKIWKQIRKGEYKPPGNVFRLSLAHCGKQLKEIQLSPTEEDGAIAKIKVEYLPKLF